jgi:hypothetical protein
MDYRKNFKISNSKPSLFMLCPLNHIFANLSCELSIFRVENQNQYFNQIKFATVFITVARKKRGPGLLKVKIF